MRRCRRALSCVCAQKIENNNAYKTTRKIGVGNKAIQYLACEFRPCDKVRPNPYFLPFDKITTHPLTVLSVTHEVDSRYTVATLNETATPYLTMYLVHSVY